MPEAGEHHCAICLQPLTARLTLDGCEHDAFCRECIEQWGRRVANTCPLCRARFNVMTVQHTSAPALTISIPDREVSETDYDETSEDDDASESSDDGTCPSAVVELLNDIVRQAGTRPIVNATCVAVVDVVTLGAICKPDLGAASLPNDVDPLDYDPLAGAYLMRPLEHLVRCCSDTSGDLAIAGRRLTGSEAETMALLQRLQIAAAFSNHAVHEFRRLTAATDAPAHAASRMIAANVTANDCAEALRLLSSELE